MITSGFRVLLVKMADVAIFERADWRTIACIMDEIVLH
jgi:hypothetical protein